MISNEYGTGLLPKKNAQKNDDSNLIPLINIVFLLLIFFLVAGQVSNLNQMEVNPPTSTSEKQVELSQVTIILDKNNHLFLDGQALELDALPGLINAEDTQKLNLYVDQTINAQQLDTLLATLRNSGIAKITLFSLLAERAER